MTSRNWIEFFTDRAWIDIEMNGGTINLTTILTVLVAIFIAAFAIRIAYSLYKS